MAGSIESNRVTMLPIPISAPHTRKWPDRSGPLLRTARKEASWSSCNPRQVTEWYTSGPLNGGRVGASSPVVLCELLMGGTRGEEDGDVGVLFSGTVARRGIRTLSHYLFTRSLHIVQKSYSVASTRSEQPRYSTTVRVTCTGQESLRDSHSSISSQ